MNQFLSNLCDHLARTTPRQRRIGAGVMGIILIALLALIVWPGDGAIEVDPAQTVSRTEAHVVQSGEFLIKIANDHDVPWEAVAVVNETELARINAERCGLLNERYTKNTRRPGHYCNETVVIGGKPMVNLNSLKAGDVLQIPFTTHPVVDAVIRDIPGQRIAIVIDDTGSMNNDNALVSAWYMRATEELGKELTTVVLYANGHTREFTNVGKVDFRVSGDVENTRNALEVAAASNPDAIVLVSDEPGDDWKGFWFLDLPPVYSHSLEVEAHDNLRKVSKKTGGQFMRPPLAKVASL